MTLFMCSVGRYDPIGRDWELADEGAWAVDYDGPAQQLAEDVLARVKQARQDGGPLLNCSHPGWLDEIPGDFDVHVWEVEGGTALSPSGVAAEWISAPRAWTYPL